MNVTVAKFRFFSGAFRA